MPQTRSMASLKSSDRLFVNSPDILSLTSDSSIGSLTNRSQSSKRKAPATKKKVQKKSKPNPSGTLSPIDMYRFWGMEQKIKYDSGELETLVLGTRTIVNDLLFEDVFGTKFFGVIPYMNDSWPDDFEVTLKGTKSAVAENGSNLSDFGPLSLCFEHRILAHIIATTLLPRKGSLSNISNRDVFVLYCLLKKYRINWAAWFKEYMWESVEESNPSACLPYGLLISRILVDRLVDLSML
uniref:Ulp1 protease family, C-terminal catalytic domain containing protein n=1 Tax=Solanum tuberosum TaxID=4113 RepID=M1DWF5_SOLTU